MNRLSLIALAACLLQAVPLAAEELAATAELPEALRASPRVTIVSVPQARAVRGQDYGSFTSSFFSLLNNTTLASFGSATTTMDVVFGGATGGLTPGGIEFNLSGKAVFETFTLQGGQFSQDFGQLFQLFP